jgi:hypothetical protein
MQYRRGFQCLMKSQKYRGSGVTIGSILGETTLIIQHHIDSQRNIVFVF